LTSLAIIWGSSALLSTQTWALVPALIFSVTLLVMRVRSRGRCAKAAAILLVMAGDAAGLDQVDSRGTRQMELHNPSVEEDTALGLREDQELEVGT